MFSIKWVVHRQEDQPIEIEQIALPATSATSEQTASEGPAAIDACSDAKTTSKKSARSGSKQATLYALAQFGFSRREALSVCCIDEAPILRGWSEWCVWIDAPQIGETTPTIGDR
jgi:hypothetical protein